MNIAFFIAHPSQYYMFHEVAKRLRKNHKVTLIFFEKDVMSEITSEVSYKVKTFSIASVSPKHFFGTAFNFLKKEYDVFRIARKRQIDLIVGTSVVIAHVAKLIGARSMIFTEDDIDVIKLSAKIGYPFCDHIVSPSVCDLGRWDHKAIRYEGYQKLAYLHPNIFNPDDKNSLNEPYFLIRFSNLSAHHDVGIKGIDDKLAKKVVERLKKYGQVYISSEKNLSPYFETYRLDINPANMHQILAGANMLISDSQSMSVEAAMLGVPSIRFSDFVGRISVLEELEHKYGLTFGFKTGHQAKLLDQIDKLLQFQDLKNEFQNRRKKMLEDKINVCSFIVSLLNNYPESCRQLKNE